MELLFSKTAAFLYNIKCWSQTHWTILRLQVYLLFPKKLCNNHFRRFESKNVFSLMYGKPLLFPSFLRRAPKRFRCFWDAIPFNDICYWLSIWLRYGTLANVLYFMRIDNFRVRDISRIISETRFMPSSRRRFFFFSQNWIYLDVYFPSALIGFAILREGYVF